MLSQKQKAIIGYLQDGPKQKKQIVNRFKSWYYSNSSKYIGEIITRMVEKKIIVRESRGLYKLRKNLSDKGTTKPNGQAKLF